MDDFEGLVLPAQLTGIIEETRRLRFVYASDLLLGSLLRTLAATKPGGKFLELGTGTGVGTSWLLDGMDVRAELTSIDRDPAVQEVARKALGGDGRVRFITGDGGEFIRSHAAESYDLIFADGGPGKLSDTDVALRLLRRGGIYVGDDLCPHLLEPPDRAGRVREFLASLSGRQDVVVTRLSWSSGLVVCARRN